MTRAGLGERTGMTGRERREHPRIEVELPVDVTVLDVETGQPLDPTERTTLANISRGGLCAKVKLTQGEDALEKVLTRKRLLHVRVHLEKGEGSAVGVCRVAWCEKLAGEKKAFLMGLAWSEISEENGELLERFIRGRMGGRERG